MPLATTAEKSRYNKMYWDHQGAPTRRVKLSPEEYRAATELAHSRNLCLNEWMHEVIKQEIERGRA